MLSSPHQLSIPQLTLPRQRPSTPVCALEAPAVLAKQRPYQQVMTEGVTVCVCVVCVCKGLLKSTEVRSYSSKDGNIDILFNHLFLCLLPFKQLGPLIHGQEQRGHWYLGLIFEQRFIVMAECWAWEGGETENATHTLEDVCMCVKCMCW